MRWLYSGEAASLPDGILLLIERQIIKLTTSESFPSDILFFGEDANAAADGHSRPLVVTWRRRADMIIFLDTVTDRAALS